MDGMLSQDEINALLSGMSSNVEEEVKDDNNAQTLTPEEIDAIGEIGNISMGSAATTLSALLNQKVTITTPSVTYSNWREVADSYEKPCVLLKISYIEGLSGDNVLILKEDDVKIITKLMMGMEPVVDEEPLSELHLSAIGEAMNQMMGTAATSMSSMMAKKIDITPPDVDLIDLKTNEGLEGILDKEFVKISFQMDIGDLIHSQIMQLYPFEFAKEVYNQFIGNMTGGASEPVKEEPKAEPKANTFAPPPVSQAPNMGQPMMGQPMMGQPMMGQAGYGQYQQPMQVDVSQASFQPFAGDYVPNGQHENIDLIMDVPLEVTVELGRTNKSIKEILEFAPGAILELNKIAGEPVDVLVNGKHVAKGEVVVIEESFGVRISEIIK